MYKGAYLLCLLGALGGLAVVDAKLKLALWYDTKRAAQLIVGGVAFFLVWDIAGIQLDIFAVGNSQALTGLQLLPNLPIEEPLFLTLLMYQSIILWELLRRRHAR